MARALTANRGRGQTGALIAIALGGALGAPARYEISQLIHVPKDGFPWATFWTNISGAFVLGLFLTVLLERFPPSRYPRPFFAIGFLGAYTTFSTMTVETATLIKNGHAVLGVGYILVSLVAGLLVAYSGVVLGRVVPLPQRSTGQDKGLHATRRHGTQTDDLRRRS